MSTSKTLVFFGSGPVAAESLALLAVNFKIEAVVTKPKPAHHRGDFPVIDTAQRLNIPLIYTATKAELVDRLKEHNLSSRLGVVIDYGIIIPKEIIDSFELGIVNSHFSLLPQWRGADPITFAILSGQTKTGISLMLIVEKMDEGPLLAQAPYEIRADETTPSLTEALVELSDKCLTGILPLYMDGQISPAPQHEVSIADSLEATYSRKLTKKDGEIRWQLPAEQIEREIRAFAGWPKSYTQIFGKDIIVTKARVVQKESDGDLVLACGEDYLEILELIGPSGRKMSGADFIRGYKR